MGRGVRVGGCRPQGTRGVWPGRAARQGFFSRDGSIDQTRGEGCHVVHLHGSWHGRVTLHVPAQLGGCAPGTAITRFVKALGSLDCKLTSTVPGIHEGRLGVFPLRVVETVPVSARAGEHLPYTVTPRMLTNPDGFPGIDAEETAVFWALREHVEQLRHPPHDRPRRIMKDEDKVIESFDQVMTRLLVRLSPEQRLAGLAPEQRLAGLAPEQRMAGSPPSKCCAPTRPSSASRG